MNGPGACGKECPLEGGTVKGNTCPWIDHCAMWRDELAFERLEEQERLEQLEKAERLAKEHPEMFRGSLGSLT